VRNVDWLRREVRLRLGSVLRLMLELHSALYTNDPRTGPCKYPKDGERRRKTTKYVKKIMKSIVISPPYTNIKLRKVISSGRKLQY